MSITGLKIVAEDTDLQRFVNLYKSFGVECKVSSLPDSRYEIVLVSSDLYWDGEESQITVSEKFKGYTGFHSSVYFDSEGKFIEQGFWE